MKKIFSLAAVLSIVAILQAQAPAIEWQKCIGGSNPEEARSMKPAHNGGYIMIGVNDETIRDGLVIKTDATGNIEWQKTYGGEQQDDLVCIELTTDGGYIMGGYTMSSDGDVTGNHGNFDYWVVKIDGEGDIQWQKCLGGSNADVSYSIHPAPNGYIIVGNSLSTDGNINLNRPDSNSDCWIAKLDETGNVQWQKFIDSWYPFVKSTPDGGYIIAGHKTSNFSPSHYDFYIVKLSSQGNILWENHLGGSNHEVIKHINLTPDGGYIVSGYTLSNDGDVTINHGSKDAWMVKLNEQGTLQWEKSLGGLDDEEIVCTNPTPEGGYITIIAKQPISGDFLNIDYWIVKLTVTGDIQWEKTIGGTASDYPCSIFPLEDGSYILGGSTQSNDGDVSGQNGVIDFWLVKLTAETVGLNETNLSPALVYPNPVKDVLNFHEQYKNVTIYSTDGKMVIQANDNTSLNVSGLQAGIYFLKMETSENKTKNVKFVKN